jgi:hypothetical protein
VATKAAKLVVAIGTLIPVGNLHVQSFRRAALRSLAALRLLLLLVPLTPLGALVVAGRLHRLRAAPPAVVSTLLSRGLTP